MERQKTTFRIKPSYLFWFSVLLFQLLLELVYRLQGFQWFFADFIGSFIQNSTALFLAFSLNKNIVKYLDTSLPWQKQPVARFLSQTFWFVILSGTISTLFTALIKYIGINYFNAEVFISVQELVIYFVLVSLVLLTNVVVAFALYLLNKWSTSNIEAEQFEKQRAQLNLDLLRNQINPHFLFNNLNTLSALIHQDADKASQFLRQLSEVYRNILAYKNRELVSVNEELTFFNEYRKLLETRFSGMLFFNIQIDNDLLEQKIIPLTLQLLIENAIKHNVVSVKRPLTINVTGKNKQITVSNNLQPKETLEYSSGLGLKIINNQFVQLGGKELITKKTIHEFIVQLNTL